MSKKVVVVLAEGFETIEALAPIDILRRANLDVCVAGLSGKTVVSAHKVSVNVDCLLSDVDYIPDALVLPGGMPGSVNLGASAALEALTCKTFSAGKIVAAICAAPAEALAKFGLLSGRMATCYPGFEDKFPADAEHVDEDVCIDGNLITGRGAGVALEFGYALVSEIIDAQLAQKLSSAMLHSV